MKLPSKIALLTIAGLMASSPLISAQAANANNQDVVIADTIKISGNAKAVVTDVRSARFALFDGQTQAALELVKKARSVFDTAILNYAMKIDSAGEFVIPLDRTITLSEDFKTTSESEKVLKKAGEMAKQGKENDAIKLMTDAGIDLDIRFVLLPVLKNINNLDSAISDIESEKFYEANMKLKAIETSIELEELSIEEIPQQGYPLKAIK